MMEAIVKHGGACMHVTGFFAYRDLPCGEASARAFLAQYQSTGVLDFADCLGVYRARIVLFHQLADGDHLPVPV